MQPRGGKRALGCDRIQGVYKARGSSYRYAAVVVNSSSSCRLSMIAPIVSPETLFVQEVNMLHRSEYKNAANLKPRRASMKRCRKER